jgi:hypothetical protein
MRPGGKDDSSPAIYRRGPDHLRPASRRDALIWVGGRASPSGDARASRGCRSGGVDRGIRSQATGDGGRTGVGRDRQGEDQEASSEERVDIKDRLARDVTDGSGGEFVGICLSRVTHGRLNDGSDGGN